MELVEGFEDANDYAIEDFLEEQATMTLTTSTDRLFGSKSLQMAYDFADGSKFFVARLDGAWPQRFTKGDTLGIHVCGDMGYNQLSACFANGSDKVVVPLCLIDFHGWRYVSVALDALSPDHDYGFSGFKLSRAHELMGKTGTIKLDNMLRGESSGINEARLANMQLAVNGDYIVVSADTWVQGVELLDINGRIIKVGEDHLVYRTGRSYDVATRQSTQLVEEQHGAVRAVPATRGGALKSPARNYNSGIDIGSAAWTEGSRVHVTVGGEERVFSPVDSWAGYLWASLSPDGKRVAFFAAGKGIVVIDLRGQVTAMLGNYEMPCWYNNEYIVAQNAKDDGHQFTSSQIVLLKSDGTWQTELTKPASMAMQPTCGGGRIVYTTIDGLLYEMKINIYQ